MRISCIALVLWACLASQISEQSLHGSEVIVPFHREHDSKGPLPVLRSGKWGYIDKTGAIVISPQFDAANFFYEGRAAIRVKDLWGYIDTSGRMAVPPRFALPSRFSDGLASVRWKNRDSTKEISGYIDTTGRVVITCDAADPDRHLTASRCGRAFSGGYSAEAIEVFRCLDEPGNPKEYPCKAKLIDRWGYYDKTGNLAIPGPFASGTGRFVDGLAAVARHGDPTVGFINFSGSFVIPPRFEQAGFFSEGLAAVRTATGWGFIDPAGRVVIESRFQSVSEFSEGMAAARLNSSWGYIDRTGRMVVDPQFREAAGYSEGLAAVCCDEEKTRYIDVSGRWAFDATFSGNSRAGRYIDGVALVETGASVLAYIDRNGRVIAHVRTPN